MLDDKTEEWLHKRKSRCVLGHGYFCPYCENCGPLNESSTCTVPCMAQRRSDYREEAEYEARVARCAVIGSKYAFSDLVGDDKEKFVSLIKHLTPAEMALMAARIQVEEEEMDDA